MAALDAGCASVGCAGIRRPHRCTYALVKGTRKLRKRCHMPVCFSFCFLSVISLSTLLLPQVFPFLQLNTINYDFSLYIIQVLCLYSSRFTPLRKTRSVNRYCWKSECYGRTWCGMCPHFKAALVHVRASYESVFTLLYIFSFFSFYSIVISLFQLLFSSSLFLFINLHNTSQLRFSSPRDFKLCVSTFKLFYSTGWKPSRLKSFVCESNIFNNNCWKFYLNVMCGTDVFGQSPGYLGHESCWCIFMLWIAISTAVLGMSIGD